MKKKIIVISVLVFFIIAILGIVYYFNQKEKEKEKEMYYISFINKNINNLDDENDIKSKNKTEKIIISYFNNIKNISKNKDIYLYDKFVKDNDLNNLFIKLNDYKSIIETNISELNKFIDTIEKNNNKNEFINYLRNNKIDKNIINAINKKISKTIFDDYYISINQEVNQNINDYKDLNKYIMYLSDNKENWKFNDNTIITTTNQVKKQIKTNNEKYNINISIKKDLTNSNSAIPIFMYHAVDDNVWGIPILFVSTKNFESQLKYLSDNNFKTLFLDEIEDIDDYSKSVILTFDDGYVDFYNNVFPLLKKYNAKANVYVISGFKGGKYLNDEQIKEMANSGNVLIGSHTVSHPYLSRLSNEEIEKELKESKENLESVTGKKITTFAYPTGDYDSDVLKIIPKYYEYSVIMGGGVQQINKYTKNQELKRIGIFSGTTLNEFVGYCEMSKK